jgi:hypothetical protein
MHQQQPSHKDKRKGDKAAIGERRTKLLLIRKYLLKQIKFSN